MAEFFDPDKPNIFPAAIQNARLCPRGASCEFPINNMRDRDKVTCVVRSRAIGLDGPLRGTIKTIQHTGWATRMTVDFSGLLLRAELPFSPHLKEGETCSFNLRPDELFIFDPASGARLRGHDDPARA